MGEYAATPARLRLTFSAEEVAADVPDILSAELWALGTMGIEERAGDAGSIELLAGFASAVAADAAAAELQRFAIVEEITDHDALLTTWRAHAAPVRAGERLVVVPSWIDHTPPAGTLVISIDPGPVFGSGSHETTRLALAELERLLDSSGDDPHQAIATAIDVGCGSGVLAIAALLLGVDHVAGIDIDSAALDIAHENAVRNRVGHGFTAAGADLAAADRAMGDRTLHNPEGEVEVQVDLVLANVLAPILEELAEEITARVKPGGWVILAGLLTSQLSRVLHGFDDLEVAHQRIDGEWAAVTLCNTPTLHDTGARHDTDTPHSTLPSETS